jgi:hypothetical protein
MSSIRPSSNNNAPPKTHSNIRAFDRSRLPLDPAPIRDMLRRFNDPRSWFPYAHAVEYLDYHACEIDVRALESDWHVGLRFPWYCAEVGVGRRGAKLVVIGLGGRAVGWRPFYERARLDTMVARNRQGKIGRCHFREERCVLSTLAEQIWQRDGVVPYVIAEARPWLSEGVSDE